MLHSRALVYILALGSMIAANSALGQNQPNQPQVLVPLKIGVAAPAELGEKPAIVLEAPACHCEPIIAQIAPRFSLRRSFGDGVGYEDGFTFVEGFIPLAQQPGCSLLFGNARVLNYDHGEFWEAQLGGGARWLVAGSFVAGVNAFYDGRNTDLRWYHQAGLGWELLGRAWELRGNVYIPVGPQRFSFGSTGSVTPQFVGTNIAFDRVVRLESTMGGADIELGRQLPAALASVRNSAYLGFYHYSNDLVQTANGVRGRLEGWIGENVSLHLAVQNDAVFDTTVTGGVGLHWGGVRTVDRQVDPLAAKLGERVVRDPNIVIQRKDALSRELAIDPATGQPIEVRHANSKAAPGGDGSVERPFQTLAQLQAGSAAGQILYAHSGSVFTGERIALQANQRFLGEGIPHFFFAQQGTFLLPKATGGTTLPVILNAPGSGEIGSDVPAITIASGTEVSGLHIDRPFGLGIVGENTANVNINRNVLTNGILANGAPGLGRILLVNVSGTSTIANNTLASIGIEAIDVEFRGTSQGTVYITGNKLSKINSGPSSAIFVLAPDTSFARVFVNGNIVESATGAGIGLATAREATGVFQVANNFVGTSRPDGFRIASQQTSSLNLQLLGNTSVNPIGIGEFNASSFQVEDTLGSNSPFPTITGGVTIVPFGTFGFPPP
ncbi:MAG: inverse autotransporter beta domain-containing protein [Gemmataceae bacterium]|nr:inverse autotransporter beta domain-containing protein [Gemmataceae bacterium]MCI0743295.1 inverse autotransporter beta domain-containing protein [Gemmataceae bacterium]